MRQTGKKETKVKKHPPPTPHGMSLPQKSDFEYMDNLIKANPWKAFVLIHATLEFQLRVALWIDDRERIKRSEYGARWPLIFGFRSFVQLANICFIVGIIDGKLRDKLITFNTDRNQIIGHVDPNLRKRDISDETIARICQRGLELMRDLLQAIQAILFGRKQP